MPIAKSAVSIKAPAQKAWGLLRALDFSFIHPAAEPALKGAKENAYNAAALKAEGKEAQQAKDKANTALSFSAAWTAAGSVRVVTVPEKIRASLPAKDAALLFDREIKVVQVDDAARTASFKMTAPASITLDNAVVALPTDATYTLTVAGDDAGSEVTVSADDDSAVTGSILAHTTSAIAAAFAAPYPYTPRRTVFDDYFGTVVPDYYRYLEDPDSAETVAFVEAQNELTNGTVLGNDAVADTRGKIRGVLENMYDFPRFTMARKEGDKWYYSVNSGKLNQFVLRQADSLADAIATTAADAQKDNEKDRVFLDLNARDPKGTTSLGIRAFSDSGKLYAYGTNTNGSDWTQVRVLDTATRKDLTLADGADEVLDWVKFSSLSWFGDAGFFYCRYPAPSSIASAEGKSAGTETDGAQSQALYYHAIGTPQSEDVLVYSTPENPSWMFGADVTDFEAGNGAGKVLIISISDSCDPVNRVYTVALAGFTGTNAKEFFGTAVVNKVIDEETAGYDCITNVGDVFYYKTNKDAPRGKVIAVTQTGGGAITSIVDVVPEDAGTGVLNAAGFIGGKMVLIYTVDVCDTIRVYALPGEGETTATRLTAQEDAIKAFLPSFASLGVLGKHNEPEISIYVTSALHAGASYVYNLDTQQHTVFKDCAPAGFDASKYAVKQVFYPSLDGTKIPMLVMHKKDAVISADAPKPVYLYAYGGFSIALTPSFSVNRWLWMDRFDGVACVANLRGGNEYGEDWHKAGCLDKKQNVFDDFYSAATYLVKEGYTTHEKIGIHGGSNGGLLVGASVNQRPQAWGAAVAAVGVHDMLRFPKHTIGYAWCSDYGNSEESKEQFTTLHAYSPVHTVPVSDKGVAASLPPTLLCTADHDDRVVPLHSFKYAAALQRYATEASNAPASTPLAIRVETNAGHGAGKPLSKVIDEHADVFAFFAHHLGAKWHA